MFIKLTAKGINYFVDENNTRKIKHLKENFLAEVEIDKTGKVKRYTSDDVRAYVGNNVKKETAEEIFGIHLNVPGIKGEN